MSHNIVVCNFGNDSISLLQWCIKNKIENLTVIYVDTGWANSNWHNRINEVRPFLKKNNINLKIIKSNVSFSEAVIEKNEFPSQKFQWCSGLLKGLPILNWLDEIDPFCEAKIIVAAIKSSSNAYINTDEYIEESEHFGGRDVWHPVLKLSKLERNALIKESGMTLLSFERSLECDPCVNCKISDLKTLSLKDINKVSLLEKKVDKTLFENNFEYTIKISEEFDLSDDNYNMGCGSFYGCGT